jgi:hypothetical protein
VSFRIYQLQQGVEVEAESTVFLLPSGLSGVRGALRRLVHPDSGEFPPLVYYLNPTRTFNFSTDVLRHPIAAVVRTLSSSKTIRFEEVIEDVVVVEQWETGGGVSMPLFMAHQLMEYLNNPPAFASVNQTYIIWEPRDETDDTYEVEVLGVQIGGGSPGKYSMKRFIASGGPSDPDNPGPIDTPTDTMDVSPTALIDQVVTVTMRIISKIEA